MRSLFLAATLLGVTSAHLDEYKLSEGAIQIVAASSQTSQAALSPCIDQNWNACQYNFNKAVGIDETLGYRSGSQFFNATNALLDSIQSILNVCKARTQFYQCLGSSYYTCMNLFNILQKPGEGYQDAFDYSRAFLGMEFTCTAGFETVATEWSCMINIQNTLGYRNCLTGFNELLSPDQLCPSVKTVSQCIYDAYLAACVDKGAGFFETYKEDRCEMFILTRQELEDPHEP